MRVQNLNEIEYEHDGNLFYSPKWLAVLKDEYDFDLQAVSANGSQPGEPLLIFAKISDIFGRRIISLPFSDYTEPHTKDVNELYGVLNVLKENFPDHAITLKYHGELPADSIAGLQEIRQAYCHRISLSGEIDEVWRNTSRSFRKGVKKARRCNLRIRPHNQAEGIDIFHQLLTELRRDKFKILPQPKSFYRLLLTHFIKAGQGNLWLAFKNETPIAAALVLHSGSVMFDKMGVSDQQHLDCRPNNLLLWEIMKYGHAHKLSSLDMGLTPQDNKGLIRFKESLGATRSSINYYRIPAQSQSPDQEAHIKRLLADLTRLIADPQVPDKTVQGASKILYKYFC